MLQYVARHRDWQGRGYFLAVLGNKQLVEGSVRNHCPQHAIEQVGLEVYENVVPVLNEVLVVVEVQDELRMPYHLVFPPLGELLGQGDCEVSLVQPHCDATVGNDAIGVQVDSI